MLTREERNKLRTWIRIPESRSKGWGDRCANYLDIALDTCDALERDKDIAERALAIQDDLVLTYTHNTSVIPWSQATYDNLRYAIAEAEWEEANHA